MEIKNIREDQEVQLVGKNMPTLLERAKAVQITDELSSKAANDDLKLAKEFISKLETRRKFFVKPLQDHVSSINGEFKKLTSPLKEAYEIVRGKLTVYATELDNKRRAEEEARKKEGESKSKAAADFLGEDVPAVVEEPKKQTTAIRSSLGSSNLKKIWTFEVVDIKKIPLEYMVLDEKKVNAMIRAHTRNERGVNTCDLEIPGIKVFQKSILAVR